MLYNIPLYLDTPQEVIPSQSHVVFSNLEDPIHIRLTVHAYPPPQLCEWVFHDNINEENVAVGSAIPKVSSMVPVTFPM